MPVAHPLTRQKIARIVKAELKFPSGELGMHTYGEDGNDGVVIRHFNPGASAVTVVHATDKTLTTMKLIDRAGLFAADFPGKKTFDYKLHIRTNAGRTVTIRDPYHFRFHSLLADDDVARFSSGNHDAGYHFLGGRLVHNDGIAGVNFTVWAPNAKYVSVAGVFNGWNMRAHPMNARASGLWELFIPGLKEGSLYKFVIHTLKNKTLVKSDPYAFAAQLRPKKSSIVWDIDRYNWSDGEWMRRRASEETYRRPVSVYELHLGSWIRKNDKEQPFHNYREIADDLIPYLKDMGFSHVELLPPTEHPLDQSWGYQVTSYFAPTSRFGSPDDFMYLIDQCHRNGIGVILDWVPAHFPRDPHGLARFDGTHLYEHADPRKGFHPDWKTSIFNYGRFEVRNFLMASALFWIRKYHIDGIRVDAVASMLYLDYSRKPGQWLPNKFGGKENLEAIAFLRDLNATIRREHPGVITLAEESTAFNGVTRSETAGGLGFTYKWNMGWMNDTLEYIRRAPSSRKSLHGKLSFMLHYAFHEKYMLVLSHDEVVHGKRSLIRKMPGLKPQKFANLRLLYGFMYAHPGKKTLFMGSELAQYREWSESREIDWYLLEYEDHRQVQSYVRDLNKLYRENEALHKFELEGDHFRWIDFSDAKNSVISFVRSGSHDRDLLLFVFNFMTTPQSDYRIGVPQPGYYREVFNSNAAVYGGSNTGNHPGRSSQPGGYHGHNQYLAMELPPLSMEIFRLE